MRVKVIDNFKNMVNEQIIYQISPSLYSNAVVLVTDNGKVIVLGVKDSSESDIIIRILSKFDLYNILVNHCNVERELKCLGFNVDKFLKMTYKEKEKLKKRGDTKMTNLMFRGKSKMEIKEMDRIYIENDNGWVTGYAVSDAGGNVWIVGNVIESNEEYIVLEWWAPVYPETVEKV